VGSADQQPDEGHEELSASRLSFKLKAFAQGSGLEERTPNPIEINLKSSRPQARPVLSAANHGKREEGGMRLRVMMSLIALFALWAWLDGRAQTDGPIVRGAHRFEKVAEGIYYTTASGTMNVGANSPIILTDDEALVIDSQITPAAGRALVADLKAVTSKPVRYVVDSHYHYDHAFGNQVFVPGAEVIGHDNTRRRLLTNVMEQYTYLNSVQPVPARVDALKQRIAQEPDPQQKAALERQVANSLAYLEQVKEVRVTPPNLTFDQTMTLYRGTREIRLFYLGRGHTDTDVVVFLPKERIVCTGDLMESVVSYMGDSYPEDWIATLERLKGLDFDTVMPGHGVVFKGKEKITAFQKYLRDVITQVTTLRKQGLSAEDAAQKVDVTAYRNEFASIRGVGIDVAAVRRIYQLADHAEPGGFAPPDPPSPSLAGTP
jgi:cyclase